MAHIGRNDPCPCGSGRKYKHCCLKRPGGVPLGWDDAALTGGGPDDGLSRMPEAQGRHRNAATDVLDELRAAMAEREFDGIEELQAFTDAFMDERNRAPLEDFHGLSPEQMHRLLAAPFDAPDLLEAPQVLAVEPNAPILDLFLPLAEALSGDGLKATAKGNLPRAVCRDLAVRYFTEERLYLDTYASVSGHREEDFRDLHYTRRLARKAGLIRLARGRWRLTARGRELLEQHGAAGVYPLLLRAAAAMSPWPRGSEDGLDALIRDAWSFTAWLLTRYGEEPRPSTFYQEAFVRAFPRSIDLLPDVANRERAAERGDAERRDTLAAVVGLLYAWSGLRQFAGFLGLARIETVEHTEDVPPIDRVTMVRATPLLREAVRFRL